MKFYEQHRSRSFIDLGPSHSDLTFSNFFSSIKARPTGEKFHVERPWDGRTKLYSYGHGHMIKMAAMLIYGKNLKIFISRSKRP